MNPGYAHHAHTISNRAPSTTQPTLQAILFSLHRTWLSNDIDYIIDLEIRQYFYENILTDFGLSQKHTKIADINIRVCLLL